MRILHLTTGLDFGGIERRLEAISGLCAARGDHMVFASLAGGGIAEQRIRANGGEVVCLGCRPSVFSLRTFLAVLHLVRRLRPEVVHAHGGAANFHGLLAARIAGVPVRFGEEIGIPSHSAKAKHVFRSVYATSSGVIAVSKAVATWLEQAGEARPEQIRLVENPVILPTIAGTLPPASDRARLRIGFVGRLVPEKNLDCLIDALHLLAQQGDAPELWIIGEGPLREALETRVADAELAQDVRFVGFQSEPHHLLRQCDIFVLPSRSEGSSNALLEAMSLGLPAIATAVGAAPEVIREGENGWLVPPARIDLLADRIRHAQSLRGERLAEMGQAAQKAVAGVSSLSDYYETLMRLYESARAEAVGV